MTNCPKIKQNSVSWSGQLTTNVRVPFILSLSKEAPGPSLHFGTGSAVYSSFAAVLSAL
jgi:hypothetical protein